MNELLAQKCHQDLTQAHFICDKSFLTRFVASLLAKRFVILTGLAGSGKTRLAQSFARWITPVTGVHSDPFMPGAEIRSDRISYIVKRADRLAVEFWNEADEAKATKVLLPRSLIQEWAEAITENGFGRDTTARQIREMVGIKTKYSSQLNSFETHLKAAAFALLSTPQAQRRCRCYEVVSVGADWTSSEQVLGYPDGLDKNRYIRTKTLDLILRAEADSEVPHFLILDEMNLSHVERYFADILSAIESGEAVHLHSDVDAEGRPVSRDGVPGELLLPPNLFIIGTVNVDETTYMFSPKVLDRANVLEFRVSGHELKGFLTAAAPVDFNKLEGVGKTFGAGLMALSRNPQPLPEAEHRKFASELCLFFDALAAANAEFGFRVAKEAAMFMYFHKTLSGGTWDFTAAMDAQILQKLLPKLHGSRNVIEPILCTLAYLCFAPRTWEPDTDGTGFAHTSGIRKTAVTAGQMEDEKLDPLGMSPGGLATYPPEEAYYRLSFEKILRMIERLRANGFTSFVEA